VQSELRVGRLGRSRLDPQFHAAVVHAEIVGGLFGSRLNRVLREEKGYTYGAAAGFDFRRGRGPFTMRTAVETSVTVPALLEARRQVESPLHEPVTQSELDDARNYLRGTFPLRFGAAAPVSATVASLSVIGLNVEELDRYRDAVTAVDAAAVTQVALDLSREAERIVVVGDAAQIAEPLRAEGFAVTVKPAIPA
jgi:predicted Zn-dependent peptidase